MAELKRFLRDIARRPFIWGVSDCELTLADWVLAVEGWDPAADLRGTYDDEAGAAAVMAEAGGAVAMISRQLRRPPCTDVRSGDIGLIEVMGAGGTQIVGAICIRPDRWAAKSPRGVWIGRAGGLTTWRIG
jgi:hypothetical protein